MTLVERVAEWPKQWLREDREQGVAEGRQQGVAEGREQGVDQQRALLCRSVRVNNRWRVLFRWGDNGPEQVRVADYH